MTPDTLRLIGETELGEGRWQSPLARILKVNVRTLQRYASGDVPIPGELASRLLMIAELAEAAAVGMGESGIMDFVVTEDERVHPTVSKPYRWVRTVRVVGIPSHLDPVRLHALARLVRRPRDWSQGTFRWSEL